MRSKEGNWSVHDFGGHLEVRDETSMICKIPVVTGRREEAENKARLLAKAPQMLDWLRRMEAHLSVQTGKTGEAHAEEGKQLRAEARVLVAEAESRTTAAEYSAMLHKALSGLGKAKG